MSITTIKITRSSISKILELINKEVFDLLELLLAPFHLGDHFLDIFVIHLVLCPETKALKTLPGYICYWAGTLSQNKTVENTSWIYLLRGVSKPSHGLVLDTNKFNFPLVGLVNVLRILVTILKGTLIDDHDFQYRSSWPPITVLQWNKGKNLGRLQVAFDFSPLLLFLILLTSLPSDIRDFHFYPFTAQCELCKLFFSAQLNKLRPISKFEFWYRNEHLFVLACSSARKIHFFTFLKFSNSKSAISPSICPCIIYT